MKTYKLILSLAATILLIVSVDSCGGTTFPEDEGNSNEEQVDPTPTPDPEPEPEPTPEPEPDPTPTPDPEPEPDPTPEPEPEPEPTPREVSLPSPIVPSDGKTLKVLAIGNSFSQDAAEQYLYELFKASGQESIVGNMYIGGCTIDTHWKNTSNGATNYEYRKVVDGTKTNATGKGILAGIKDENWDVITVQQASGSSGIYSTYSNLNALIDYIKTNASNPDVVIVFHQTWSYSQNSTHGEFPKYDSNQMTMYNMICDAVSQMYNDCLSVAGVIPSGTAIQNARTSYLGDTFNRDGYHLEVNYGRFTAACTWFEALTGKDATANTYKPSTVSDSQARVAKAAAHAACQKLIGVTDLVDFKNPPKSESLTLPSVAEEDGGIY